MANKNISKVVYVAPVRERGLKFCVMAAATADLIMVAPVRERGLKSSDVRKISSLTASLP